MTAVGVEEREQSRLVRQETDCINMHCCVANIVYVNENKKTVTFASKISEITGVWKYRMVQSMLQ